MERRKKKTQTAIYSALTELLSQKKYSQITVQEIIDFADIGRSTFYSHFETKDELLKSMCLDIFNSFHLPEHISSSSSLQSMMIDILCHIKENQKAIKGIFIGESGDFFMEVFKNHLNNQLESSIFSHYDEKDCGVPKDFFLNHISGSFVEMVKWWVAGNMKESPEKLAEYYLTVIEPIFPNHIIHLQ